MDCLGTDWARDDCKMTLGWVCRHADNTPRPLRKRFLIGRQLGGETTGKLFKGGLVQTVKADKHRDIKCDSLSKNIPESATVGFVFAKLVDNQQVNALVELGGHSGDRRFQCLGIKTATACIRAKVLTDTQYRAIGQDAHIHVTRACIRAFGVDLNGAA